MGMIADILLIVGATAAAAYCIILSKRLQKFTDLEKGVGGAIAVLSSQVETLSDTLETAQSTASQSSGSLNDLTDRAEAVSKRLELLMASMHDLPNPAPQKPAETQPVFSRRG